MAKETHIYERYMYPGPEPRVPVNKLNLKSWPELESFEAAILIIRVKKIPEEATRLSYTGFKALHKHLFQDVYSWAGKERPYTTGRNPEVPFAKPEYIANHAEAQFAKLKRLNYFIGMDKMDFCDHAAEFINEINAAHPFIEGNGRVQRLFLQILADNAGYVLDLREEDRAEWNRAAEAGFLHIDHLPTSRLLFKRLSLEA